MYPDLFWIPAHWPGRLAIAARPRGGDWLEDEIHDWRKARVDLVISLLEANEEAQLELANEAKLVGACGIDFVLFPIPDRGIPSSTLGFMSLIARALKVLNEGKTVVIHCRQGLGRSGLTAVGILTASGINPEEAIKIVSAARGVAVPETNHQRQFLQRLQLPVIAR